MFLILSPIFPIIENWLIICIFNLFLQIFEWQCSRFFIVWNQIWWKIFIDQIHHVWSKHWCPFSPFSKLPASISVLCNTTKYGSITNILSHFPIHKSYSICRWRCCTLIDPFCFLIKIGVLEITKIIKKSFITILEFILCWNFEWDSIWSPTESITNLTLYLEENLIENICFKFGHSKCEFML